MHLENSRQAIALWLFVVCALIALMVVVGGLTRLTGSGLSITQWKPIHGALPPLSIEEWNEEFNAYKQIPQYQKLNHGMSLDEFKGIFWWEWGHRNLGRLIGLAYLLPFLYFLIRKQIEPPLIPRLIVLFLLGGLQGVLGWFMVASGLTERTDVSQYRLAAHLGLALLIYVSILMTALPLWRNEWPARKSAHALNPWSHALIVLIFVQILLGAFVAGLDAGLTYNTWPLMDGAFIPEGAYSTSPIWLAPFEDVTTVQFNHRIFGYLTFASTLALVGLGLRTGHVGYARSSAIALGAAVSLQVAIGIWTLLAVMPIGLAALHQFGAVVLLTAAVFYSDALKLEGAK